MAQSHTRHHTVAATRQIREHDECIGRISRLAEHALVNHDRRVRREHGSRSLAERLLPDGAGFLLCEPDDVAF